MLKTIKDKLHSGMGKDVIWTFSIQLLIMLCAFIINKVLASRLSIEDFGQFNVIKRSVQVLSFVMLAGVGIALPRYIPLYRNGRPAQPITPLLSASLIYIINVSVIVLLGSMLFSGQIQNLIIGQNDNLSLLLIVLGYAFMLAMAQFAYAYYRGIGNFKWYNGTQLSIQLSIVLPLILLPALDVTKVFVSWLIITTLLVAYFLGRELVCRRKKFQMPPLRLLRPHLKTIIKYSSGRLVADFFQFSLAAFPLIYISNVYGLQPTAYYSVGLTFVTMITPIFSFMGIILLPYVSECIARNEMQAANRLVNRLALLYLISSLLAIAGLYLFTEFLTRMLFAESYVATADVTRVMILSILPQAAYMLYRNTIDAVSVIPYNAIILGICITVMVISFSLSTTLHQLAWAYLAVSCLQGFLSWLTWSIIKRGK